MMIGSLSHIAYADFAVNLAPIAVVGLVLMVVLIALSHRSEFASDVGFVPELMPTHTNPVLMLRALVAVAVLIALLFAGQPPAKASIVVGALLLLTRRVKSERIYAEIDWSLLLMFAGLFIIVAGAERTFLSPYLAATVARLHIAATPILTVVTAVLSNVVSNVPAVLVLKPFVQVIEDQHTAWLTIAMASTLAGNLTVIGSIANLIVIQGAAIRGVRIGFWNYAKVGAPLTILTLTLGTVWLWR
jgi:Na+/H+ antiporter NhaD/arsenite permease-like protein